MTASIPFDRIARYLALSLSFLGYSGCSGTTAKPSQICEQAVYSEQDLNKAFTQAKEKLIQEGYGVRSLIWNDEEKFTRLTDYMVTELGCTPQSRHALRETEPCEKAGLETYLSSAYYCGPGAVMATGICCPRGHAGCLNEVCYYHDRCYDELLQSFPGGELCLWSKQTRSCDDDFFTGYQQCLDKSDCGFWCQFFNTMAINLTAIEAVYDVAGPGCFWKGEYAWCEEPDDSPDGGSGNDFDGGTTDCFTQYCDETSCVFSEPFYGQQLNLCRWRVDRENPLVQDGALQLSNNSGVVSDLPPRSCSRIEIEYRSRIDLQGFYFLNLGQVEIVYSSEAFPNQLAVACSSGNLKVLEGVDATQWQTIRLEVDAESSKVYVNDVLKRTVSCGQQTLGNVFFMGPFNSAVWSVDYVKKKCE